MKNQSTKIALAVVVVVVLAGVFWMLLLSPKRERADELSEQVATLRSTVSTEQQRATEGLAARREFPRNYQQMILLGKAVPAEADTASLLVQLNGLSGEVKTPFISMENSGSGEGEAPSAESTSATESAVALAPLGSSVGPAGFRAMPYTLQFVGGYFALADYIHGLDSLVETKDGRVDANGRLVTVDGFSLNPIGSSLIDFRHLEAEFQVNTYVTPPGQGLTAGATPGGPAAATSSEAP